MHCNKTLICCLALAGLLWGAALQGAAEEPTLHFLTDERPPYWDETLPRDGLCGEILHTLAEAVGMRIDLTVVPNMRMNRYHSRIPHLTGNPALNPDREFSAVVPVATLQAAIFFYAPHHENTPRFRRWQDLQGLRLGAPRGWAGLEALEEIGVTVEESNSEQSLFHKLLRGRLDAALVLQGTGLYLLHTEFQEIAGNFVSYPVRGTDDAIALMFNEDLPNGAELGRQFNAAMDELLDSGGYLDILEKYYGDGNAPQFWDVVLQKHRRIWVKEE